MSFEFLQYVNIRFFKYSDFSSKFRQINPLQQDKCPFCGAFSPPRHHLLQCMYNIQGYFITDKNPLPPHFVTFNRFFRQFDNKNSQNAYHFGCFSVISIQFSSFDTLRQTVSNAIKCCHTMRSNCLSNCCLVYVTDTGLPWGQYFTFPLSTASARAASSSG